MTSLPLESQNNTSSGLTGRVAIDLISDQAGAHLERELSVLRRMGWKIGGKDAQIALIDGCDESNLKADIPALILCKDETDKQKHNAVLPENAFDILTALGGAKLEQALAASVGKNIEVDKVVVGLNWTMVRAGDLCGIARSPARGTEGARTIRPAEGFVGKSLDALASYLCSTDALSRSLGLAAVNCYWNRREPLAELDPYLQQKGGFGAVMPPGDGLVIIGGFREVQKRLPNAKIIEREPKPGDIPVEEAPQALRTAQQLAITAQTLMNGSLEPVLATSGMVPRRSLVGPSAPLCPLILQHGLDESCGLVVIDPDATEQFILETGTMIMLDHLTQNKCIAL